MQGIYEIRNKISGKQYIGSSVDVERRRIEHIAALQQGEHFNPHLQHSWNKWGEQNFVFDVIEEVNDRDELLAREQVYLDEGFGLDNLYNVAEIAGGGDLGYHEGMKGKKHSQETRDKMSEAKEGYIPWNKGGHLTQEHKDKLSIMQKEWHGMRGNPSRESMVKMSESLKEWHRTHEHPCGHAKPYPAFFNTKTVELIPAGNNLKNLCRELRLNYESMLDIKIGNTAQSRSGWKLADKLARDKKWREKRFPK